MLRNIECDLMVEITH